jgi:hypothetical protein
MEVITLEVGWEFLQAIISRLISFLEGELQTDVLFRTGEYDTAYRFSFSIYGKH